MISDTARLAWLFSDLNDETIAGKLQLVSALHANGAFYGIALGDYRAAIDKAMPFDEAPTSYAEDAVQVMSPAGIVSVAREHRSEVES